MKFIHYLIMIISYLHTKPPRKNTFDPSLNFKYETLQGFNHKNMHWSNLLFWNKEGYYII